MMFLMFEVTEENFDIVKEDLINKNDLNYTLSIKNYNDSAFITQKKTFIILILLIICILGGLIVTYVNVNDDFNQLNMFYVGYMGRILVGREIIQENNEAREDIGKLEHNGSVHLIIYNGKSSSYLQTRNKPCPWGFSL